MNTFVRRLHGVLPGVDAVFTRVWVRRVNDLSKGSNRDVQLAHPVTHCDSTQLPNVIAPSYPM
jgi:hypothetical protein